MALPLARTFVLAAAEAGLIDLRLPADTPELLQALLADHTRLGEDGAASLVDRTVDVLEHYLGVQPDPRAGLAEAGHALAQLDLLIADAAADARAGLPQAVAVTIAAFDEVIDADDLAQRLGRLGLGESAVLVAATA